MIGLGIGLSLGRAGGHQLPPHPIAALFANGEQGVWLDPSDLSTMFQDGAGTVPVTASGQPVGRTLDKSGRGNHVNWQNATYQTDGTLHWIAFNGSSTSGQTAAINFSGADEMFISAAVRKIADSQYPIIAELSPLWTNASGTFVFGGGNNGGYVYGSRGGAGAIAQTTTPTAPVSSVVTGISDISAMISSLRVDGVQVATNGSSQGAVNYGNHVLNIGARNGAASFFNGRVFGLIIRGKLPVAAQQIQVDAYHAAKAGVTL